MKTKIIKIALKRDGDNYLVTKITNAITIPRITVFHANDKDIRVGYRITEKEAAAQAGFSNHETTVTQ